MAKKNNMKRNIIIAVAALVALVIVLYVVNATGGGNVQTFVGYSGAYRYSTPPAPSQSPFIFGDRCTKSRDSRSCSCTKTITEPSGATVTRTESRQGDQCMLGSGTPASCFCRTNSVY